MKNPLGANRQAAGLASPLRPHYERNVSPRQRNNPVGDAAEAFWRDARREFAMLAEKFILFLESLIRSQSRSYPDGSPRMLSTSPFVPIKPSSAK
jgi:hypothetical protein